MYGHGYKGTDTFSVDRFRKRKNKDKWLSCQRGPESKPFPFNLSRRILAISESVSRRMVRRIYKQIFHYLSPPRHSMKYTPQTGHLSPRRVTVGTQRTDYLQVRFTSLFTSLHFTSTSSL